MIRRILFSLAKVRSCRVHARKSGWGWLPRLVIAGGLVAGGRSMATLGAEADSGVETTNEFTVIGSITEASGKPLEGVNVRAYCGIGTLHRTGTTITASNGQYRLVFGPGVLLGSRLSGNGIGIQACTIYVEKDGYFSAGLGRAGNLAMSGSDSDGPEAASAYAGIVRPYHPYRLDFVLMPAATIEGQLTALDGGPLPKGASLSLAGKVLPPSSSVLCSTNLAEPGNFRFADVPVGSNWWFEVSWSEPGGWRTLKSKEFSCGLAANYHAAISLDRGGGLGFHLTP
jgi:hypothetical protein